MSLHIPAIYSDGLPGSPVAASPAPMKPGPRPLDSFPSLATHAMRGGAHPGSGAYRHAYTHDMHMQHVHQSFMMFEFCN